MNIVRGRWNFLHGWIGLMTLLLGGMGNSFLPAQSNIVVNGSFEAADTGWNWTGALGIEQNNYQAYDGTGWVQPYSAIWQDLPTEPGRNYFVRFATKNDANVRVRWQDNPPQDLHVVNNAVLATSWVVTNLVFAATADVTRLQFEANPDPFRLDAVEVLWLEEPVSLVAPVASRSSFEGGAATFFVNAIGGPPLHYQWYRDTLPLLHQTNRTLTLTNLTHTDAGQYSVSVTNEFFGLTSPLADLVVHPLPSVPLIVAQPKPRTAIEGYVAKFHVVGYGNEPISYQWMLDGTEIPWATNSYLDLPPVTTGAAGDYSVLVSNHFGTALSIEANLEVLPAGTIGGWVNFGNRQLSVVDAPIFDTDQTTRLAGSNYVVQLYAGATPESLQPVGAVIPFRTGMFAGYFTAATRVIPDVASGQLAFVQARAWDFQAGKTYEEAQSRGGRFGRSKTTSVTVTAPPTIPQVIGFNSFSLEAGRSPLATAKFDRGEQLPGGGRNWRLIGDPGSTYVVESRAPPNDWAPILVLTNHTGAVDFVDTNFPAASVRFYRAQILEP